MRAANGPIAKVSPDMHGDVRLIRARGKLSQRLREDDFAPRCEPFSDPTIAQIEALRTSSRDGAQLRPDVTGISERPAGRGYEGLTDAATFVGRIDKQSPDTAVARIAGRQSCDDAVFFPDVDRPVSDVPFVIRDGDPAWIGQAVLANRPTNFD